MNLPAPPTCNCGRDILKVGRTLGIAYYRRMYPHVNRARELIRLNAIGKPVFAEATSHCWVCPGPEDERSWFIDPAVAGGGPLYDIASHRIDLMNYLFGTPTRATACLLYTSPSPRD